MRYRNISGHPEDLADGSVVGTGAYFELSDEAAKDDFNKAKIEDNKFLQAPEDKKPAGKKGDDA